MSKRAKHGRDGLFGWKPGGDIEPGEIRSNPRHRECPKCHARRGQPCTDPRGRRLNGYHASRCEIGEGSQS